MKKRTLLLASAMTVMAMFMSCSNDTDALMAEAGLNPGSTQSSADASLFPVANGEKSLPSTTRTKALMYLVTNMDKNRALTLETVEITNSELNEIKAFVDQNLAGATQKQTYDNIFKWITQNIKYAWSPTPAYLRPYDVFKYKTCVCQGYADLLKTMCITQGIPVMGVNGELGTIGAHAWNYVCADNVWYVSDPTNNQQFIMESQESDYREKLIPEHTDIALFEDEIFLYNFEEGRLNVSGVKANAPETITIPYGVAGYIITTFNPLTPLPVTVKNIYVGKKIQAFSPYTSTMRDHTPGVEAMYIDPSNQYFVEYEGAVYKKTEKIPYYIPTLAKRVVLKEVRILVKNTIYGLEKLETVVVANGTEKLESFAIEKCPNLKTVVLPLDTEVEESAVYNCGSQWEYLRMESTGIHNVTM